MRQKLHLAVSKDDLRPSIQCALLTKDRITATDAHILVSHLCTEIFDQSFIDTIPKGGWLIDLATLKLMNKAKVHYHIEGHDIVVNDKGSVSRHAMKENGKDMNYPKWEDVIPDRESISPVESIGVSPKLLFNLQQAIDPDYSVVLDFIDPTRAILVRSHNLDVAGCRALIMPTLHSNY